MKKLKLYKKNKSQKSKLSEIFDVVKNADQRACSLLTLLTLTQIFNNRFPSLNSKLPNLSFINWQLKHMYISEC